MKFRVRFADGTETTIMAPTIFGAMNIAEAQYGKRTVSAKAL
jgi:hypothetical protein